MALIMLLTLHLFANWRAVRSCCLKSLNRQRANILFSNLIGDSRILTPAQVAARENIFEKDAVLRWQQGSVLGHCRIGTPLASVLQIMTSANNAATGSAKVRKGDLNRLLQIFERKEYLIWFSPANKSASIVLRANARTMDQLEAWVQSLVIAKRYQSGEGLILAEQVSHTAIMGELEETKRIAERVIRDFNEPLRQVGWDLDAAALETGPGTRMSQASRTKD